MDINFEDYYDVYKIIVIGDSGTGKTNIIQTYNNEKKSNTVMPTVGIQYYSKTVQADSAKKVKVQIWDTAGQQQYRSITMGHYKKSVGAFVIFDLTNRRSFENVRQWIFAVRDRAEPNVQIGLIGNKTDSEKRAVSRQEGQKLADEEGIFYMETSIYDIQSIKHAFERLIQDIYRNKKNNNLEISNNNIDLQLPNRRNDGNCSC